jgi:hypothetical protein
MSDHKKSEKLTSSEGNGKVGQLRSDSSVAIEKVSVKGTGECSLFIRGNTYASILTNLQI